MTKQKQMTERELTKNVELSDEELDTVSAGMLHDTGMAYSVSDYNGNRRRWKTTPNQFSQLITKPGQGTGSYRQ